MSHPVRHLQQGRPSGGRHHGLRLTPTHALDARLINDPASLLLDGEQAERRGDYVAATNAYAAAAGTDDPRTGAEARFRLGRVAWRQGRLDDALVLYERARAMADECGAVEIRAAAEIGIGTVQCERGAYAQARASYQVAHSLTANPSMRGKIHLNLGVISALEGDVVQARSLYEKSAQSFQLARDDDGLALALHNLGMLAASREEWEGAETAYRCCVEVCERMGNRSMLATVLLKRVELLCARERLNDAVSDSERALALFADLGDEVGRVEAFRWQGHAFRRLGRHDSAEMRLRDAARIAARLQLGMAEGRASEELGVLLLQVGRRSDALAALERARARYSAMEAAADTERVSELLTAHGEVPRQPAGKKRASG
ncbi:MAG TPA: tetratricopeptide repeat protein [Gemmatimonadaceae bacterium]|nr:tetratricopeptide repeat protein [Gemmatimonadaceae bacterium]